MELSSVIALFTALVAVVAEVAVVEFPIKSPLKVIAVNSPVKGLNPKRLVLTFGCKDPVRADTKTG